jgi:acetyl esterase/lipase
MKSWQAILLNGFLRVFVKHRSVKDLKRLRAKTVRSDSRKYKIPNDVTVKKQVIGQVPCQWITTPVSEPSRVILYLHGGAFCLKFPKAHILFISRLCRQARYRALYVDYRLAPEHPFPAAPDDCFMVYQWLLENGTDPMRIVIAGDSAGGNLALATLVRIKDAGIQQPACAVMFSPATDMTLRGASFVENKRSDAMFTLGNLMVFRLAYMGDTRPDNPLFSPLYADFDGLPPMFFQVSRGELLRDSSVIAAQQAKAAGVDVVLDMHDGMPHCFGLFGFLPESEKSVTNAVHFIQSRVNQSDDIGAA